jgi:hypothetical protein
MYLTPNVLDGPIEYATVARSPSAPQVYVVPARLVTPATVRTERRDGSPPPGGAARAIAEDANTTGKDQHQERAPFCQANPGK